MVVWVLDVVIVSGMDKGVSYVARGTKIDRVATDLLKFLKVLEFAKESSGPCKVIEFELRSWKILELGKMF